MQSNLVLQQKRMFCLGHAEEVMDISEVVYLDFNMEIVHLVYMP